MLVYANTLGNKTIDLGRNLGVFLFSNFKLYSRVTVVYDKEQRTTEPHAVVHKEQRTSMLSNAKSRQSIPVGIYKPCHGRMQRAKNCVRLYTAKNRVKPFSSCKKVLT